MNARESVSETLDEALQAKIAACREALGKLGRVVVAYSGGADSTLLLALAAEALGGDNVLAAMGISPSLPARQREEGRRITEQLGVELVEVETRELDNPDYAANTQRRCFYCKSELLGRLRDLAGRRGFSAVASGANADDAGDFRPGLEAGRLLGVGHPLMDAGLTKADVRAAARAMGLTTWNKPAMACLASRVPYGQPLSPERLSRIEKAEYVLNDLGFAQCRVRDHEPIARIEVPPDQILRAVQLRETLVEELKALGYTYVALDLEGFRSGSMNEPLMNQRRK